VLGAIFVFVRGVWIAIAFAVLSPRLFAQAGFEVASVRLNSHPAGPDARGRIQIKPAGVSAKNVSLKDLIVAGWNVERYQVLGGPGWLDTAEYDVEATAPAPSDPTAIRQMLRQLLFDRFHLSVREEKKELRGYALSVAPGGLRISRASGASQPNTLEADTRRFAAYLSIQLTIPAAQDPTVPSIAGGTPVAVVDETGLIGVYRFPLDLKPELSADPFLLWKRFLSDRMGLNLEAKKVIANCILVERADRVPEPN
jgi:uncharacterized protein (TIGR03435 family)